MNKQATIWEVFIQSKNGLAHKHAGNVHAEDKEMALQNARDLYTRRNEGSCIWVVKSEHIVSSVPEDAESFFDPANDKVYRHPTFYKMPDGAKHI
ncbi:MAG: 1,2-phenylacetyl-CoA epoxidase subunit B [Flavobacteriales bacterium]|jgi:ring-1,2-phenylacetyl-CoA epoxidase subunit PaaB|nr:1,2-phenylacetyl-CoA epoxidase subunit B [Flavobacteriales bacterium]